MDDTEALSLPSVAMILSVLPEYPIDLTGSFQDGRATDNVKLANDGGELSGQLRGVRLVGNDFDGLTADLGDGVSAPFALGPFGDLSAGLLTLGLPCAVQIGRGVVRSRLEARIQLPPPDETVRLSITLPDGRGPFVSPGTSGWFEDELVDLTRALPSDTRMVNCFSCGLSDYSPYGHGLFGSMECFRGAKTEYRAVSTKLALFKIWDRGAGRVQETHLCEEWEPRPRGRGYRG
jgi:hypothetical protein